MPKIKTKRASVHEKAAKVFGEPSKKLQTMEVEEAPAPVMPPPSFIPKLDNVFSKVDIDLNAVKKQLMDQDPDDCKSGITRRNRRYSRCYRIIQNG